MTGKHEPQAAAADELSLLQRSGTLRPWEAAELLSDLSSSGFWRDQPKQALEYPSASSASQQQGNRDLKSASPPSATQQTHVRPWEVENAAELLNLLSRPQVTPTPRFVPRTRAASSAAQQFKGRDGLRSAIEHFKQAHPILSLLGERLGRDALRRVASTNGGEWAGPCPLCGGEDRLRAWPTPGEGSARAWCRQCEFSGDALDWATKLDGRDPREPGATAETLLRHGFLRELTHAQAAPVATAQPGARTRSLQPDDLPAALREQYEERAAILEFDAALTRAEAEATALATTLACMGGRRA
jgi:primase-helicase-like zinc-binding protein